MLELQSSYKKNSAHIRSLSKELCVRCSRYRDVPPKNSQDVSKWKDDIPYREVVTYPHELNVRRV